MKFSSPLTCVLTKRGRLILDAHSQIYDKTFRPNMLQLSLSSTKGEINDALKNSQREPSSMVVTETQSQRETIIHGGD